MTQSAFGRRLPMAMTLALATLISAHIGSASAGDDATAVVKTYADIAQARYADSLAAAKALDAAVDNLIAKPSAETLMVARQAWRAARIPYMQTEVFRFGNPIVDDWEGRVNSWPLDEGLIDYVATSYGTESDENTLYTANVIANKQFEINGKAIDASDLSPKFLASTLQSAAGVDANVATGYHAIEFLLWGQDLHATGPGAGERPYTDYDLTACTHDNCDRRAEYLKSATDLLVSDLQEMTADWDRNGPARNRLEAEPPGAGIAAILTGMGSLSYGELAGQRMKLGVLLHDPEEEHDCFSDNTHISHLYDAVGIRDTYRAFYKRLDGTIITGPSVSDMVREVDPALDEELRGKLDTSVARMVAIVARVIDGEAYDQQIDEGNTSGNATIQAAIDALVDQTHSITRAVSVLKIGAITVEGDDSLDSPGNALK